MSAMSGRGCEFRRMQGGAPRDDAAGSVVLVQCMREFLSHSAQACAQLVRLQHQRVPLLQQQGMLASVYVFRSKVTGCLAQATASHLYTSEKVRCAGVGAFASPLGQ